jgi:uncharacterized damage-inducible protein DinB
MTEFNESSFYKNYASKEEPLSVAPAEAYARHAEIWGTYLSSLPESKAGHRYADGKWSVREVVGHITDTSMIFLYRTVCIARGEKAPLPSFEENDYAAVAGYDSMSWRAVLDAWKGVSLAASGLLPSIDAEGWGRLGIAAGVRLTPRDMLRSLMGHERHHFRVLKERYGLA